MEYLAQISKTLGMSIWLLMIILFWELTWKLIAMWKAARKGSVIWFIVLAIFNTVGILPILYIFIFSKLKCCQPIKRTKRKLRRKK